MNQLAFAAGIVAVVALLGGCASSGVVLTGPDVYLIKKQGGLGNFGLSAPLLADLRGESDAFCLRTGRAAESLEEAQEAGDPPLRSAAAKLRFRCVPI